MQTNPPDKLLAALNHQLDRAVRVVPHPRENFASAVRAMQGGSYDTPSVATALSVSRDWKHTS